MTMTDDFANSHDRLIEQFHQTLSDFRHQLDQIDRGGGFSPAWNRADITYEDFTVSPGTVFRVVVSLEPGEEPFP